MQLLEANFAQIEHINQIIHNNMTHDSWSCFDTHYLLEAHEKLLTKLYTTTTEINNNKKGTYNSSNPKASTINGNFTDIRFDSFIVNITKITNGYRYSFEIRNALWDGTYRITKSKNSSDEEDEYYNKGQVVITRDNANMNNVTFTITGTDSNRVRICFHMNMAGEGRNIQTTSLKIDNPTEYTHQYDMEVCEEGHIYTEDGEPVSGVDVSIEPVDSAGRPISTGIEPRVVKNIQNGKFRMCYSAVDTPGDYYVLMKVTGGTAYQGAETTQLIHIRKVQKESISILWGDPEQYKNVWKGSIKTFEIKLNVKNELGVHDTDLDKKLLNIPFTITNIKLGGKRESQTCRVTTNSNNEYVINPTISYRNYYEDQSRIELEIPLSSGFGNRIEEHIVRHEWFKAESYEELERESTDVYGADWIFLYPQTYTRTKTIEINRKLTIAGMDGTNHCLIDGRSNNVITVNNSTAETDNYMEVNIIGIAITNAESAIKLNTGCRLLVDRCYFYSNKHTTQHHRGCSIFMPTSDTTIKENKLWKTEIRNSYFNNNKGNEIQSIGTTYIHNNLFKTTDKTCLQQPEVKVVSVRAGNVSYKHNKSYINIPFNNKSDAMPSNHSYAKALAYVENGAKFNGRGPANLKGNKTLPLFGNPYNNEAYTRACYYYPHGNVKTYIVCSPERGNERRATGHASSVKNWVFYDGYYFVRLASNKGNTRNPWTTEELTIPSNLGIFNNTTKKFITGYDPRYSNCLALTSEV